MVGTCRCNCSLSDEAILMKLYTVARCTMRMRKIQVQTNSSEIISSPRWGLYLYRDPLTTVPRRPITEATATDTISLCDFMLLFFQYNLFICEWRKDS